MRQNVIIAILLLIGFSCKKKEGCTDVLAENFDNEAKRDNGTCVFLSECSWENYQISAEPNSFTSHCVTDIEEKNGVLYLLLQESFTVTCSRIYKSVDQGKTWVYSFSNCGDFGSQPHNLLPVSKDTIYGVGSGTAEASLLVSTDQGNTWTKKQSLYAQNLSDLGFVNSKIGYVSHSSGISKTVDYGNSWSMSMVGNQISSLQVFSEDAVFALGKDSCYKSIDGGATWNIILQSEEFTFFDFLDKERGVVGGKSGLFLTVDGGSSWNKIYSEKVNKLSFMNASTIYIITEDQTISFSEDSGASWTKTCEELTNNSFIKGTSVGVFAGLNWASNPSENGERTGIMKR